MHNACLMLKTQPETRQLVLKNPLHSAFHNLCDAETKLPREIKSLLGLGLNFCQNPTSTTPSSKIQLDRIEKDYYRRIMFAFQPPPDRETKLYSPDPHWTPKEPNPDLVQRMKRFQTVLRTSFSNTKRQRTNLLPSQQAALTWLMDHPEIVVCATDKNLGPAVMERGKYLRLAYRDHLSDQNTYKQLTQETATSRLQQVFDDIASFGKRFRLTEGERTFIERKLDSVVTATAFLYLSPKIHKKTLKTRPIISYCGSLCEGIAKWADEQLKKIVKHLPYVATSSKQIVDELTAADKAHPANNNRRIFTMDAVSMYTNIHVGHALDVITDFLTKSELGKKIQKDECIKVGALTFALHVIMENNVFTFGNTHWLQTAGTAMGTPPAPSYATLYFAIHEIVTIPKYPEIGYSKRYIDDGFGEWVTQSNDTEKDDQRWTEFLEDINAFGIDHPFFKNRNLHPLCWEAEERSKQANFLDLTITLGNNGYTTTIYEKKMNLYLYIPPHSCHPPGVIKGLIFGAVNRAKTLCSNPNDRMPILRRTLRRLVRRGHTRKKIVPIFNDAIKSILLSPKKPKKTKTMSGEPDSLFLHLPYNPADPPSKVIQTAFKNTILHHGGKPTTEPHALDFNRLTVCYHGQRKLGNGLAPRKLRLGEGFKVSEFIDSLKGEG